MVDGLQGNVLRSTKGIQMLPHLEELDLRSNLIASIHEVVRLSGNCPGHACHADALCKHVHVVPERHGGPEKTVKHSDMLVACLLSPSVGKAGQVVGGKYLGFPPTGLMGA